MKSWMSIVLISSVMVPTNISGPKLDRTLNLVPTSLGDTLINKTSKEEILYESSINIS